MKNWTAPVLKTAGRKIPGRLLGQILLRSITLEIQMVLFFTHEGVHSNKSYKQFNGTRRLRSAFANQARTSVKVIGPVLAMVDTKGHFQRFATEPVGLDWFAAFSKGCK